MVVPTKTPDRKLIFGKGTLEHLTGGWGARVPAFPQRSSHRRLLLGLGSDVGEPPAASEVKGASGAGSSEGSPALPSGPAAHSQCPMWALRVNPAVLGPWQCPVRPSWFRAGSRKGVLPACMSARRSLGCIHSRWALVSLDPSPHLSCPEHLAERLRRHGPAKCRLCLGQTLCGGTADVTFCPQRRSDGCRSSRRFS